MKALIAILLLLGAAAANAQQITFERLYGGDNNESARALLPTNEGGYILLGTTESYHGGETTTVSGYMVKVAADGEMVWERPFSEYYEVFPLALQKHPNGGYAVVGLARQKDSASHPWYAHVDAEGTLISEKLFAGIECTLNRASVTGNGDFIMAGSATNNTTGFLMRVSGSGNILWRYYYSTAAYMDLYDVQQTRDGGFVLAGAIEEFAGGDRNALLMRVNASGKSLWSRSIGTSRIEEGIAVQETDDGGFVMAAIWRYSFTSEHTKPYFVRADSTGTDIGTTSIELSGIHSLFTMARTSTGNFILTGEAGTPIDGTSVYLATIDQRGMLFMGKQLISPAQGKRSRGFVIHPLDDGNYIIAGDKLMKSGVAPEDQMMLLKVTALELPSSVDSSTPVPTEMDLSMRGKEMLPVWNSAGAPQAE
jgi:hypothetical protein